MTQPDKPSKNVGPADTGIPTTLKTEPFDTNSSVGSSVKDAYEGGLCPDCGENIPGDAAEGQSCTNCGHAFFSASPADDATGPGL